MLDTSHYAVLGLAPGASTEDIKKAHRRLVLKWHPDKVQDPEDEIAVKVATQQFQLIQAAYEVLTDPLQRHKYDQTCHKSASAPTAWKRPRYEQPAAWKSEDPPAGWATGEKTTIRVPADAPSVAAAVDCLPVNGGTIWVQPGKYVGLVVISKPFVKIIGCGADPKQVEIKGQVVFRECALGSKLQGLNVNTSCTGGAVDLKGVRGNITIEGCHISNEISAGIIFEGCSGETKIYRCHVVDCKYDGLGLHLLKGNTSHQGKIEVTNSSFERNGYDGMYLGDPRFEVTVTSCSIKANKRHGICVRGSKFEIAESFLIDNGQNPIHKEEFKASTFKPTTKIGTNTNDNARENRARELGSSDLPEGWRAFRTAEGLTYYYQSSTGATRWSHPSEACEKQSFPVQDSVASNVADTGQKERVEAD